MNWQPIETAPKDGSRVLVFEPRGKWAGERGLKQEVILAYWHQPGNSNAPGFWCATTTRIYRPTHWMPLPDPPK